MPTSRQYLEQLLPNKNIQAALTCIRTTEGTTAADGYQYLFGSTPRNDRRFTDYRQHPNRKYPFTSMGKKQESSAAGAYQILWRTYVELCANYGFKDFTPRTQDLMALALFDQIGVLHAIRDGKMLQPEVMDKLNNIWASLPLSEYGQPTKSIELVTDTYIKAGGFIA